MLSDILHRVRHRDEQPMLFVKVRFSRLCDFVDVVDIYRSCARYHFPLACWCFDEVIRLGIGMFPPQLVTKRIYVLNPFLVPSPLVDGYGQYNVALRCWLAETAGLVAEPYSVGIVFKSL